MLPFAHNIPSSQLMATGVRWMFEQPQNLSIEHRRNMQFYCKLPRTGVRCSINDNIACAHVREDRDVHHSIFHRRQPYHLTTSASLKEENITIVLFAILLCFIRGHINLFDFSVIKDCHTRFYNIENFLSTLRL